MVEELVGGRVDSSADKWVELLVSVKVAMMVVE